MTSLVLFFFHLGIILIMEFGILKSILVPYYVTIFSVVIPLSVNFLKLERFSNTIANVL